MASEQLLNGIPSGSGGIPKVRPERLSVTRYAKVTPPSGRYYLGALAAHWRFAGGGARRLAPFENPFKTTLYDKRQAEYTLPARGQAHRVCQRQGHPGAEAAYPAAGREVRHDRQQLHTGKGFRPKARLTARQEAVMETLIGCRSDLINYTSALRGMAPEKRRQMFGSYPFMLGWLKELGRLAERITAVLDKVQLSNRLPDGTRNDEDGKEEP